MRRGWRWIVAVGLTLGLVGCAGLGQTPPNPRQALQGLAADAARGLLEKPPWAPRANAEITVLLRPAQVDANLPIDAPALNEALGRALLARQNAPHVLDWVPTSNPGQGEDQWLLEAHLRADAPPLRLSDRTLQPYRLRFDLSRSGSPGTHWQWQASGALDLDALPVAGAP